MYILTEINILIPKTLYLQQKVDIILSTLFGLASDYPLVGYPLVPHGSEGGCPQWVLKLFKFTYNLFKKLLKRVMFLTYFSDVIFEKTYNGKPVIIYKGNRYNQHSSSVPRMWRFVCTKKATYGCTAYIKTHEYEVLQIKDVHTHHHHRSPNLHHHGIDKDTLIQTKRYTHLPIK